MHFDSYEPIPLAVFTATPFIVEGKPARIISANARGRQIAEEIAYRAERTSVGSRIRARGTSDRTLINNDNLVELLDTLNRLMRPWTRSGTIQVTLESDSEDVIHESGFSTA
jgi:hypothetical protein